MDKQSGQSLSTTCEQTFYNLFADLQQSVQFYARYMKFNTFGYNASFYRRAIWSSSPEQVDTKHKEDRSSWGGYLHKQIPENKNRIIFGKCPYMSCILLA